MSRPFKEIERLYSDREPFDLKNYNELDEEGEPESGTNTKTPPNKLNYLPIENDTSLAIKGFFDNVQIVFSNKPVKYKGSNEKPKETPRQLHEMLSKLYRERLNLVLGNEFKGDAKTKWNGKCRELAKKLIKYGPEQFSEVFKDVFIEHLSDIVRELFHKSTPYAQLP